MAQEFESAQIPGSGENVFHWNRSQIEAAFGHLDTTDAQAQGKKYADAASEFDQGLETFKRSVSASIAEAWSGASAESAKNAIKQYTDDAANLTDLFADVSIDIKAAADAVVKTKNSIPAAARHSWTADIWPPRAREEEKSRANADSDARDAMSQHYVQPFSQLDRTVPVVPASMNPLNPAGATGPSAPGASGPSSSGASGPSSPGKSGASGPTGPSTPGASGPSAAGASGPGSQQSSDRATSNRSPDSNAPDTASTTKPSAYNANSTTTTPSGLSAADAFSDTGGSQDSASGGGLGRSVPGTSSTADPAHTTAAANAARAETSGLGGLSGMGAAGRGKSDGDGDRDHETPDYLINEENTRELIGDIPRTVPGGVIGGDYEKRHRPSED